MTMLRVPLTLCVFAQAVSDRVCDRVARDRDDRDHARGHDHDGGRGHAHDHAREDDRARHPPRAPARRVHRGSPACRSP